MFLQQNYYTGVFKKTKYWSFPFDMVNSRFEIITVSSKNIKRFHHVKFDNITTITTITTITRWILAGAFCKPNSFL